MTVYADEDWQDKMAAQQRHEHLAATVRIAIGELCFAAEQMQELQTAEKVYGVTEMLEAQLVAGKVAYTVNETRG